MHRPRIYLFISHSEKYCYLNLNPEPQNGFSCVVISSDLEVFPLVVWQQDGSVDYLEVDKFGNVLNRVFVWYPLRFMERPICHVVIVNTNLPGQTIPRVALSRIHRLIVEKKTFLEYKPTGISVYFDLESSKPFYHVTNNRCLDAVNGERLTEIGDEIEEIIYPSTYRPYPISSRRFNLVLLYRPTDPEKQFYLFNALTGNLISTTSILYKIPISSKEAGRNFSLGVIFSGSFHRPNPNMCRRFYKYLPKDTLRDVKRVQVNPLDNILIRYHPYPEIGLL